MNLESDIRWGIIGCGDVTEVKSGPAFQKAEGSSLVAVMRRNGQLAKDYAERHKVPRWYDQADQLIHDPEVDAVYIATPPAHHKQYALEAMKAGKPVYVEKPMATHYRDCEEMIELSQSLDIPLYVAYYRRALPDFLAIKQMLDQGKVGDVRYVHTYHVSPPPKQIENNWRIQPDISGGGLFYDLASHTLDILDFLLGPISEASGYTSNQGKKYEAEDSVTASYLFEQGFVGSGMWCFDHQQNEEWNEIGGTKGKIRFSTFGNKPVFLETEKGVERFTFTYPENIQLPLIQSIVHELQGKGVSPSNGLTALRTNRVMDYISDPVN